MSVVRFGVSLERDLLNELDMFVEENKFANRSRAIRHLISNSLDENKWHCSNDVAGSLTLLYDHHSRGIVEKLTDIQHDCLHLVVSSMHLHIEHSQCIEIIAVRGSATELSSLADRFKAVKGVNFARLTMTRVHRSEGSEGK